MRPADRSREKTRTKMFGNVKRFYNPRIMGMYLCAAAQPPFHTSRGGNPFPRLVNIKRTIDALQLTPIAKRPLKNVGPNIWAAIDVIEQRFGGELARAGVRAAKLLLSPNVLSRLPNVNIAARASDVS
ncbi:hypothetical protein PWP93_28580 [Paraburkholderia sp. A1RI-2L]|uniref:hypothetical protein n=1 Tax=Paraburkholderia sp. A1RI-2L TaxID=3028367 RepID=UPI003B7B2831